MEIRRRIRKDIAHRESVPLEDLERLRSLAKAVLEESFDTNESTNHLEAIEEQKNG